MINQTAIAELSNHKTSLLAEFLTKFLQPAGNKRKYAHNEFSYLFKTLQKIFSQYGKTELSELELLTCLSESGYGLYVSGNKVGNNKKESTAKSKSKAKNFVSEEIGAFIYVGVSSKTILGIKRATQSLALQKKPVKAEQLLPLRNSIIKFFIENLPR